VLFSELCHSGMSAKSSSSLPGHSESTGVTAFVRSPELFDDIRLLRSSHHDRHQGNHRRAERRSLAIDEAVESLPPPGRAVLFVGARRFDQTTRETGRRR